MLDTDSWSCSASPTAKTATDHAYASLWQAQASSASSRAAGINLQ